MNLNQFPNDPIDRDKQNINYYSKNEYATNIVIIADEKDFH